MCCSLHQLHSIHTFYIKQRKQILTNQTNKPSSMATSIHHPLLQSPNSPIPKPLCVTLSLITILIGSVSLLSLTVYTSTNHLLLQPTQICTRTHDPKSCLNMISETLTMIPSTNKIKGIDLLQVFLKNSITHLEKASKKAEKVRFGSTNYYNRREEAALSVCIELLDASLGRTIDSITALEANPTDVGMHSWLSTVLTNHVTCLDELNEVNKVNEVNGNSTSGEVKSMEVLMNELISIGRTSLAIYVSMNSGKGEITMRPLMKVVEFPEWLSGKDRKLMGCLGKEMKPDVVVAKDGSGKYKSLKEAVDGAPKKSKKRYVIYVKKGIYKENVEIVKSKTNVMLVGDGMDSTIITGSLNFIDGTSTFRTATVAAVGDGFIAQDIWFQNTAGPSKHQAVALRVGADQAVIHRCKIDAYQDTLYTHSNRQFYRDCSITGTIDFIFGNAAVVFQNCSLIARKPMSQQSNMVTAQGRIDPNQNTGTSIQMSRIIASSDLEPVKRSIKSYLGRPWKEYSRTVVMQSTIGDHIDPSGWSIWSGDFALKTLYYGEYQNSGPGADTSKRVKWEGYHVIKSSNEAQKFTVAELIQGGDWLGTSGVTFKERL